MDLLKKMDIRDKTAKENLERLRQITMALEAKEKEASSIYKKLNFVIEKAGIGIWIWNVKENSLKWNDNMFKIFGKEKSTFKGVYEDFGSCLHPEDRERIDNILISTLSFNKEKCSVTYRIVWPNGRVRKIVAEGIFINDDELYGLCIDVTSNDIEDIKWLR